MRALIVYTELTDDDSVISHAVARLASELNDEHVETVIIRNFEDGMAYIRSNTSIDCLLYGRDMSDKQEQTQAHQLITQLHRRQEDVPVFLLSDREEALTAFDRKMMEQVDEFAWILEDSADFIAGRVLAAIIRYRANLLPPLMKSLIKYSDVHEYSWAAPGHQGGVGFTKTPAGRIYHDFFGENLFRTDIGIERVAVGSLLDHTGAFGECERNAARIFGADQSYSVVVGTSGSNRTIMQACMTDNDVVVIDRNCHKSIEQGLILTGAKPVYMTPSRNRYGIIGPIYPQEMTPEAITEKIAKNPLTSDKIGKRPAYSVVTNCTYDGVCYHARKVQDLLDESLDRIHFDEAWYGYARFNPIYRDHFAMRDDPRKDDEPTVFATHSTHKLLNALSQASFIHIRNGRNAIDFNRFNQAYHMHATTSPLYAICASNDIAADMMDGNSGRSLTDEVIREAIDFRQSLGYLYKEFINDDEWFFKPWNQEMVKDPATGKRYAFEDAPVELLMKEQSCWVMNPEDKWHGFKDIPENWAMLDPIKVSILSPGMGDDGKLLDSGVPAALVTAWLNHYGIVPTRTTDFQIMFLFSMGITKGKWGTLVNALLSFKRHYDNNTALKKVLPEVVEASPEIYGEMGLRDLGNKMFVYLQKNNPGGQLNQAYEQLPAVMMSPRDAYQEIVANRVEAVPLDKLAGRIAANSIIPYPPGIPMLLSGESFGDKNSPHIGYLHSLQAWDREFPGFEHETEGTEIIDGQYYVMCVKE
ncbi:arginine decarboxylase [Providencia hangzhouensis]|uniref:Biodegradative arginine decarboxylase n=2 Tax=Providencia TaxID=586 RepID=A0A9N8CYY2_PRORE|nr:MULTISPECIES: arginine decarboxylase [Providencia]MBN7842692.1 arginine decarboxylase [Providencia rettgeri]MBN7855112.1 arginine decarboxylase [Providencia rettgeri]MBN7863781.1 arginine decarboxylase [Providencia rettgeri]MBN7871008.1 arginine decarboxylase [Providencia rettgeri]MBN7896054.1 arginine decarboxylase [Providencia rettgeri]